MDELLVTNNLTKKYKHQAAVNNVSINVRRGEIYGLVGKNGAGKTTLLKMIGGLVSPTNGDISFMGYSGKERRKVLSRIGILIEAPSLYSGMTAYDNLKLKCICTGVNKEGYIENLLKTVGLGEVGKKKVSQFSLGMKQRLGIAMALVGEPDLLLLDEPINGLDPQGIVEIRNTLLDLNKRKDITIIISSHILEELSKIATNFGFINNGELVKELSHSELDVACNEHIELKLPAPNKALPILDRLGFTRYRVVNDGTIHVFERLEDSGKIAMELAQNNIEIISISVASKAFENYFLEMIGGTQNV
jgi:ABC-type multidrug transport system ATPase subunit